MFIAPVNLNSINHSNKIAFNATKPNPNQITKVVTPAKAIAAGALLGAAGIITDRIPSQGNEQIKTTMEDIKSQVIKRHGITYYGGDGNILSVATRKNGAFYKVKLPFEVEDKNNLKELLYEELNENPTSVLKGLKKYIDCVSDLNRQDLVMKGLGIHTLEMDNEVKMPQKRMAATLIGSLLNKKINTDDLFYVEEKAFYYNRYSKTVYIISTWESPVEGLRPKVYKCQFLTDDKGNAIGYNRTVWSVYYNSVVNQEYLEQREPSEKLPEYAEGYKHKEFAEINRFGNYKVTNRNRNGIPNVLAHLERNGFENVSINDLQLVKGTRNIKDPDADYYTINYFNPQSGKTLVYGQDGKYKYQLEYLKDHEGKIMSCSVM